MPTTTQYPNGQVLVSSALTVPQINTVLQMLTQGMLGQTPAPDNPDVRIDWQTGGAPFIPGPEVDVCWLRCTPRTEEYDKIRDSQTFPTSIFSGSIGAGGAGYQIGNVLFPEQSDASGGAFLVTAVDGAGGVTAVGQTPLLIGQGYSVANGLPTYGGDGAGATVNITAIGSTATSIGERQAYTRSWTVHWTLYGPNSTDQARALRSALYQQYFAWQLQKAQLFPVSDFEEPIRVPEVSDGQWYERVDFECIMYEFVVETISDQTVLSVEVKLNNQTGQVADFTVTAGD